MPAVAAVQDTTRRRQWERALVQYVAGGWMAAWSAVVRYHGPRPMPRPGCIWVANHSSMIDYTILTAYMPFAAIMQLQPGWVGFLQKRVLSCLGCLWFHRTEVRPWPRIWMCIPTVPVAGDPRTANPCSHACTQTRRMHHTWYMRRSAFAVLGLECTPRCDIMKRVFCHASSFPTSFCLSARYGTPGRERKALLRFASQRAVC